MRSVLYLSFLTAALLVPKAGFKAGDRIPISPLLFISFLVCLLWIFSGHRASGLRGGISPKAGLGFAAFYWISITTISSIEHGLVATLVRAGPIVLPILLVPWIVVNGRESVNDSRRILIYFMSATLVYAGAQILFGRANVVIPGLTVNYSDYQELGERVFESKNNTTDVGLKLSSTYQNGNLYGFALVAIFPFVLEDYIRRRRPWCLGVLLFVAVAVVMTLSRTALLGFGTAALVFTVVRGKGRIVLTIALGCGVAVVASSALAPRLLNFESSGAGRVPQYLEWWSEVGEMDSLAFGRFATVGNGLGVDDKAGLEPADRLAEPGVAVVESLWLNTILYGGLLGLVAFSWPIFYAARRSWRTRDAAVAASLGGMCVFLTIEQAANLPPVNWILWIVVAEGLMRNDCGRPDASGAPRSVRSQAPELTLAGVGRTVARL